MLIGQVTGAHWIFRTLSLRRAAPGITHFTVILVHESDDRCVAQSANVQQLDGLFFHALGCASITINAESTAVSTR